MGFIDKFLNRPGAEKTKPTVVKSPNVVEIQPPNPKLIEFLQEHSSHLDWALENKGTFNFSQTSKKIEISKEEDDSIIIILRHDGNPICVKFFKNEENVWQTGTYYLDSETLRPQENDKVEISEDLLSLRSLMEALELVVLRKKLKETLAPTEVK